RRRRARPDDGRGHAGQHRPRLAGRPRRPGRRAAHGQDHRRPRRHRPRAAAGRPPAAAPADVRGDAAPGGIAGQRAVPPGRAGDRGDPPVRSGRTAPAPGGRVRPGTGGVNDPEATAVPPLRPGRRVTGMSAVLLPFTEMGEIDWDAFAAGVERTAAAGLVPAVNMDTGYGPSLDAATRAQVLATTASVLGGAEPVPGWSFVGGAHVGEPDGPTGTAEFDLDAH